ncbi:unnamed protein product [Vicia faba]|uniref:Uncharacterized protein n=1 Tax=Vicia faba TaxID=3906 RepID=A0AAV0ZN93_VICFA|nr:unnamed protein product [Vicia faba]
MEAFLKESTSFKIEVNGLKTLKMARNKFSGSIPNSLGDLASLVTLDLSSINLTGLIPESLEKLEYMVKLNLSFNKLEGGVPMKGGFMNLSQVDLQGNNILCDLNNQVMYKLGFTLCVAGKKNKRNILLPIILGIIGVIVLFASMLYLLWLLIFLKKHEEEKSSLSSTLIKGLPQNLSYGDIGLATDNFSATNLVGKRRLWFCLQGHGNFVKVITSCYSCGICHGLLAPCCDPPIVQYGLGYKASTSGDVYSVGILLLEMFIAKKPTDEMFKEGLNMNNFEKKLLNIVDQRLINHYEYSTQNFSSDSDRGESGDIS